MKWELYTYDEKNSEGDFATWVETIVNELRAEQVVMVGNNAILIHYPSNYADTFDKNGNFL